MTFDVPLFDPTAELAEIGGEVRAAIDRVLERGRFIGGPEVEAFEREFARAIVPGRRAAGVGSGTDALRFALMAVGVGQGDEVIVPVNTFTATAMAVETVGARPVLVDVDERTHAITAATVEPAIGPRTRAIVPVHLFGHPAPMAELVELARSRGLLVVEDAAQAHGASIDGRPVGSWGDAAAFSFYPSKNLGAYGDGGAVVGGEEVVEAVEVLRDLGRDSHGAFVRPGYNSRLDALQAAVLRTKLRHLDDWTERRRRLAGRYRELLAGTVADAPEEARGARHVYHLFVVRVPDRDRVLSEMQAAGVEARIHYPDPLHRQRAHAGHVLTGSAFPVAERLARAILSLPLYPQMEEAQMERVVSALAAAARSR